ncbi:MAG: DnaJ domain-containing protein [Mycoplasma sp.]
MSTYNETSKFSSSEDILAENWYEILGCSIKSSQSEIDEAYRTLARKYHPDKNRDKDAIKMFYKINSAFQVLGDREIRAHYDHESGNINASEFFTFTAGENVEEFKKYIDDLTGNKISSKTFEDEIWNTIAEKYIVNKGEFNRKINIFGTLDVNKKNLQEGIRTAFPLYHYKTCSVCRGFGKIGTKERTVCYNCDGYGIEIERIFVYVEIPKNYKVEKLFKVPGRGHKLPNGIGDLIVKINPTSRFSMKTKMFQTSFKNRKKR